MPKESLQSKKRNNKSKSQSKLSSSQSVKKQHHNNIIDVQLPVHLRTRISKAKGDSQIKEFVRLICNICTDKTEFDTFKQLQEHYDNNHNCKGYVICCDKKIFRKDRLMNHIINHINPDAFKYDEFYFFIYNYFYFKLTTIIFDCILKMSSLWSKK